MARVQVAGRRNQAGAVAAGAAGAAAAAVLLPVTACSSASRPLQAFTPSDDIEACSETQQRTARAGMLASPPLQNVICKQHVLKVTDVGCSCVQEKHQMTWSPSKIDRPGLHGRQLHQSRGL